MKGAKAIDLTVIGMGYFKAVEQLIFDLICLQKNKGLLIRKDSSRKDLPPSIELKDQYIIEKAVDVTLGSMANFIKDNKEILFRSDIDKYTKKFIIEAVFSYRDLRNGFSIKIILGI